MSWNSFFDLSSDSRAPRQRFSTRCYSIMSKTSSAEHFKQVNSFQTLSKTLLQNAPPADLERPLAYWAVAGDRRLPLAFLGRSLHDLLKVSFDELAATPGIGHKKISSLLKLLSRATKNKIPADAVMPLDTLPERKSLSGRNAKSRAEFNPDLVSEPLWEQWRETVRRHRLQSEKLGRLASSLQALPTVIWDTPLSAYLDYSVAELRQLKTHGEKRVRVILEVFHSIHSILGQATLASHLTLRLTPKFVIPLERWLCACLEMPNGPSDDSVRESLAKPLIDQVNIDCGETISRLAEGRLGIHGAAQSVKAQSKRMGITRARIYQLLEQCQQAMNLRWPNGRLLLTFALEKMETHHPAPGGLGLLEAVADLFFPDDAELSRRRRE
jgi:hypothetical protein